MCNWVLILSSWGFFVQVPGRYWVCSGCGHIARGGCRMMAEDFDARHKHVIVQVGNNDFSLEGTSVLEL